MSDLYPPEMGPTTRPAASVREMTHQRRAKFWRRAFIGLGVVAMVGLLVCTGYGVYAIRQTQNERGETLSIIKDCTEVGGDCYTRGQQQTAGVLASAQVIVVLAAACAVDVDEAQSVGERQAQITTCITDRLSKPKP